MIFYSYWIDSRGHGRGYYSYVLPEQVCRERYFADDRSFWLIPGTFSLD